MREQADQTQTDPVPRTTVALADETDADLLVYMTMAGDDPEVARAAWGQFYQRHVGYLYRVSLRAYGAILGGEAGVADLVADAFRLAYENADAFDSAGLTGTDRLRLRVRAWLGWIARRRVQTILRGRGRLPLRGLDLGQWQHIAEGPRRYTAPSARGDLVREALQALSEREQLVLRVTFQWYQPDRDHQRLPNDVAAELARSLGTTPENLRQIRRRALRRVEDHVRRHEMGAEDDADA